MNKYKATGYTLLELVIAILIFSIIAGSGVILLSKGLEAFLTARKNIEADWQGRIALEIMTRELHNIRSANDITSATGNAITFIDNYGNEISYYVNGSQLMRRNDTTSSTQVLADGTNLSLTYYDANGTTPVLLTNNIRYILVTLNITYGNANFNLTTGVYPWNLY